MDFVYQLVAAVTITYIIVLWLLRKLRIGNYDNKYVLITGCDTGFGNLLAKRLDQLGFHVFAGCLKEDGVKDIKRCCSRNVLPIEIDVSNEKSIIAAKAVVENSLPKHKGLWAVVNNAGIGGVLAPVEWLSLEDFKQTSAVNLFGTISVTKAFLPLVRKETGRVVNMASVAGRIAALYAPYTISKYGVEGFSDTLRRELYKTGVKVQIIEPGFFATSIVNLDSFEDNLKCRYEQASDEVRQYYGSSYKNVLLDIFRKNTAIWMSPKVHKVVDAYEHAITARFPKFRYVVGWDANILYRLLWNLPEWMSDFVLCSHQPDPENLANKK